MSKFRKIPDQYKGAFKAGHRKVAQQFIDEELANDLLRRIERSNGQDTEAVKALEWLSQFNNEFHKNVVSKDNSKAFHAHNKQSNEYKTDQWGNPILDANGNKIPLTMRQSLYARENAKNRDIMSAKNYGQVNDQVNVQDYESEHTIQRDYSDYFDEDDMIDIIDRGADWEAFVDYMEKIDDKEFEQLMNQKVSKNAKKKVKKQA